MEVKRKFSRKRQAIYEALKTTYDHPSAEMLYQRLKPELPDLSLATVYRNLAEFVESGEAIRVGTVKGNDRYDGNVHSHPHAVCRSCGKVQDISFTMPDKLPECGGFKYEDVELTFYGLCSDCQK